MSARTDLWESWRAIPKTTRYGPDIMLHDLNSRFTSRHGCTVGQGGVVCIFSGYNKARPWLVNNNMLSSIRNESSEVWIEKFAEMAELADAPGSGPGRDYTRWRFESSFRHFPECGNHLKTLESSCKES